MLIVGIIPLTLMVKPAIAGMAATAILAGVPFAAITLASLAVPAFMIIGAVGVIGSTLVAVTRDRRLVRKHPWAQILIRGGVVYLVAGALSFAVTSGDNGPADAREFVKWVVAASLFFIPITLGRRWAVRALPVMAVMSGLGAVFALVTIVIPNGQALLDILGVIGYQRTGEEERFFVAGATRVSARAAGTYNDPNVAGITFIVGLAATGWIRAGTPRLVLQAVLATAGLLTLSRGAMFAAATALLVIVVFGRLAPRARATVALALLIFVVTVISVPVLRDRTLSTFSAEDIGGADRLAAYGAYGRTMQDHWTEGYGFGRREFREAESAYQANIVANGPLAAIYRGGWIGGSGYLAWYATTVALGIALISRGVPLRVKALGGGLLGIAAVALTGYATAITPQVVGIYALWAGLCIAAPQQSEVIRLSWWREAHA